MDREQVIKGLECCSDVNGKHCYEGKCPYASMSEPCREQLAQDAIILLKEQEPYISKETRLNRDEYCNVGDVLDCFDGMDMKADEVFHAVCLIEWAMSKRSVPLNQLLKEQEAVVRCKDCKYGEKCREPHIDYWCNVHEFYRDGDWFCADGERSS